VTSALSDPSPSDMGQLPPTAVPAGIYVSANYTNGTKPLPSLTVVSGKLSIKAFTYRR
jgi:hypothetical protein